MPTAGWKIRTAAAAAGQTITRTTDEANLFIRDCDSDDFCDQGSNFERYMTTKAAVCSVIIVCDHTANQTATCMVVLHTNVS